MAFKRFDNEDIVISSEAVATPTWSGNVDDLTSKFFSNTQASASGAYFLDIYDGGSTGDGSGNVQYSLAYCDKDGWSEDPLDSEVPRTTPTSILYKSFKNLIYGNQENFTFNGVTSDYFYVLNINRARYRERLKTGSLELQLKRTLFGNNVSLVLTEIPTTAVNTNNAGRVYQLKGTLSGAVTGNGTYTEGSSLFTDSGSYGMFLPDTGLVILNGQTINANTGSGGISIPGDPLAVRQEGVDPFADPITAAKNKVRLHYSMEDNATFTLASEETLSSNFIFARIRNSEFNYTTNPTILNSTGDIFSNELINDPKTFITGVGLYNDSNELLAVAKLSRPLLKDSRKEALVRIKLDF
jgi:hypothetical protein